MKTEQTEQALMCVLFAVCVLLVIGVMVTMLTAHIPPVQLAHSTLKSLPLAAFASF